MGSHKSIFKVIESNDIDKLSEHLKKYKFDINKVEQGNTVLNFAISNRSSLEIIKLLISKGCDINKIDEDGYTAMHAACRIGNIDVVKILISKKANINIKNNAGNLPINLASKEGYHNIVNLLKLHDSK